MDPNRSTQSSWVGSARVLGVGLEVGIMIGGMTYLGHLADERWATTPWVTLAGCLSGLSLGIYNLVHEVRNLEKQRKNKSGRP